MIRAGWTRSAVVGSTVMMLLFQGPVALAAPPPARGAAEPEELARSRYREGVDAYRAGRYRESIDYFLEADRLLPSAALSFNIARAYEKIDDVSAALRWYRDYLRRNPEAEDKSTTEGLIRGFEERLAKKGVQQVTVFSEPPGSTVSLDGEPVGITPWTSDVAPGTHQLELRHSGHDVLTTTLEVPAAHASDALFTLTKTEATTAAAPTPAPVQTQASPPPQTDAPESSKDDKRLLRTLGIVGMSTGGAALGGALVFELLRRGAESDAKHSTTQLAYADHLDSMQSRQTAARVFAITGAVLGVAGGVLFYLGSKGDSDRPAVTAACAPTGCWSTVRGRF